MFPVQLSRLIQAPKRRAELSIIGKCHRPLLEPFCGITNLLVAKEWQQLRQYDYSAMAVSGSFIWVLGILNIIKVKANHTCIRNRRK